MGRRASRAGQCVVVLVVAVAAGCRSHDGDQGTPVAVSQVPPTVQAALADDLPGTAVDGVVRRTLDGADYYTVRYRAADGSAHAVVFNGAGNQIDRQ